MSVEIILGRAGTGKTFTLLERMKKILNDSPLKTQIIFLLPAYQTYRAELELAQMTDGAVNTVMWSFQRFARQILYEVGGAVVPRISEIGRRIILKKILKKNSKQLLYYRRAADRRGFTEILAQELKELRGYSIDAEKLRKLIDDGNLDDELKNKLHDIAFIYEKFRAEIENHQNDESDLLEKAAALIKNSNAVKSAEIFIDGFIFFDPQQRKILREIIRYAKNVYIALPIDADYYSRENVKDTGIFNRAFKTFHTVKKLAEDSNVAFNVTKLETPRRFKSAELDFIERNFFTRSHKTLDAAENFKIVEAVNKRVEVEAVARDILKIHRERKIPFRDIGIIFRDESYNDLIKPLFEIHNIPFFLDGKRDSTHHPLAELIRSALEVLRTWRAEPIFRCLRTGFFDVDFESVDLLENYVLEFGLRGKNIWTREENWHWYRHDLEDLTPSDSELERIAKVDDIRRRAVAPLTKLAAEVDAVKKSCTTLELVKILFAFIESLNIHDKLLDMSELEESKGNLALSREHLKIWDDVVTLLEQIADSADDETITPKDFEYIINEGLDALKMSLIPPGIDEVNVARFDQNSLQNSAAIYILGFSDENFPRKSQEKLLLSDSDRLHLNDAGLEISRGGNEGLLAEKFLIYRGFTEARQYLHISYPLANSEGAAMRPSPFIDRLKRFFPQIKIPLVELDVLENLGSQGNYSIVEPGKKFNGAVELFAENKKMRGSVTRFEKFNKCPFSYFAEYGLKLEQRREYKVKPPDIGNILHSVMRQFGEILKEKNIRWADVGKFDIERHVTKILDDLTPKLNNKILLSTKALEHQRDRIKKVAVASLQRLAELDRHSKFHPQLFETTFSALSKTRLVYDLDGVKMELTGKIDRIDVSEDGDYFLVIDYKTGRAYLNLWEIYLGVNLQLLTYLMVTNNLDAIEKRMPAAMLYYFLQYPVKSGDDFQDAEKSLSSALKFKGFLIDDSEVAAQIDDTGKILPSKSNFKSADYFKTLMNFVESCLKQTGERILGGNIQAKPIKTKKVDACKYCAYAEVCRLDKKFNVETKQTIDDNEILRLMNSKS